MFFGYFYYFHYPFDLRDPVMHHKCYSRACYHSENGVYSDYFSHICRHGCQLIPFSEWLL